MDGKQASRDRILLIVHQFFPQFNSGTETLCERVARALVEQGVCVDIITSVIVDQPHLDRFISSELCDEQLRLLLSDPTTPISTQFQYRYAKGIEVYGFTHSHDPAKGVPRFRREVSEPGIDRLVTSLASQDRYRRAIIFHQLHFPHSAVLALKKAGIKITFVATDFFSVCPLGSLQYDDDSECAGGGAESINCIRHLMRPPDWRQHVMDAVPDTMGSALVRRFRKAGPYPSLKPWPWQGLYYLVERNRTSSEFLKLCDRVIAPSSRIERSLLSAGVPSEVLQRSSYGLPQPSLASPRKRYDDDIVKFCFVGSIIPRKGLHVLLDALDTLSRDFTGYHVDIYGDCSFDPPYAEKMRARINGLAGRVKYAGTFESEQIYEVLNNYDYIVIPSTWSENLPLVLLSALQIGVPAIVSQAEGLLDAFPNGELYGRSFAMSNSEQLAEVLAEEISNRPEYHLTDAPQIPTIEQFSARLVE